MVNNKFHTLENFKILAQNATEISFRTKFNTIFRIKKIDKDIYLEKENIEDIGYVGTGIHKFYEPELISENKELQMIIENSIDPKTFMIEQVKFLPEDKIDHKEIFYKEGENVGIFTKKRETGRLVTVIEFNPGNPNKMVNEQLGLYRKIDEEYKNAVITNTIITQISADERSFMNCIIEFEFDKSDNNE